MSTTLIVILGLLILGGLLNFAAFIWTCVVASRHTAWWIFAFLLVPVVQGVAVHFLLGPSAMTSMLWVNFLLSLPLARLLFTGKHWMDARKPFILTVIATALIWVPLGLYRDQLLPMALQMARARNAAPAGGKPGPAAGSAPVVSKAMQRETALAEDGERRQRLAQESRAAYEKHRAEADVLFKDLSTRRAKLKVDDAKAVAAFNAEAARYAALLEQAKADLSAVTLALTPPAGLPTTVPTTPTAVTLVAPPAPSSSPALAASTVKPGPAYVPGVVGSHLPPIKPAETTAGTATPSFPKRAIDAARAAREASAARTAEAGR